MRRGATRCAAVAGASSTLARMRRSRPAVRRTRRPSALCSRATVTCSGWPTTACSSASSRRTERRSARSAVRPPLTSSTSTSRSSTRAMRSASRSPSTRSTAAASCPSAIDDRVEPPAEAALVLAQRARDGGLDARRQDRRELARRAPQLVDVALRARQQRAQIGARGLARRRGSAAASRRCGAGPPRARPAVDRAACLRRP